MLISEPANQALLEGSRRAPCGRSSVSWAPPLMHESRQLLNERVTFVEIIARFTAR